MYNSIAMDLHTLLVECARQEGFPLAGTIDLDLAFADFSQTVQKNITHYDEWLKAGFAGAMEYLVRGRDRRADPRLLFPNAQSMLCVAIPYPRSTAGCESPTQGPRYARYLQGPDYHIEIAEKLERVMKNAQTHWNAIEDKSSSLKSSPLEWKICVDTSAVLERMWAALAGLGWIGKNTLLIHPKYGSYLFLAEVLINHKTGRGPSPLPNYCGHCTRCLKGCPTGALKDSRILDSNRCISYWTLEKRGELNLNNEDRKKMGSWIAGCDVCQEVCPFNLKPSKEATQTPIAPDLDSTLLQTWKSLLSENTDEYRNRVKHSALKRVKPGQFSRNLAMSLWNTLLNCSEEDRSFLTSRLKPLIQRRIDQELDEIAKKEWERFNVPKQPPLTQNQK